MDRKHKTTAWVTAGLMLLASVPALAAGLGKLTVTSTLGQPFRGEIDLLAVDKKDLGSLRAGFASHEAFKEAKIERSPVLSVMRFSVEQKKNGDPYLKITSAKPVEEPFLDMLIELDWPSGRLVREYTVLLDPPGYGEPQAAVAPVVVETPAAKPEAAKPVEAPAFDKKPLGRAEAKEKPAAETYGPVKKGENLAGIASALKPESVSLEQMLVALFQSNKRAFAGNNMNRLKAGQILRVPEAAQAAELEKGEAVKEVKAHAADWHAYRQKLAAAVAEAKPAQEEAKQAAGGKITAAVEDKAAAAKEPAKDVLKLSKSEGLGGGAPAGVAGAGGKEMQAMKDQLHAMQEEATAKEKAIKEANQRISELEKNIREMQKLLELKNQSLADLQKQAAAAKTAPAVPAPKPDEKPAAAEQAPEAAEKPAAKPKKPMPVIAEQKMSEPSLLDELTGNPLYLGGGAVAVLLLGLLGVRTAAARRKQKIASFEDSIMTRGDLKANTVLGGTGGGKVDTRDTSFLTDFSQAGLGAIDTNEVDPIAEAEVYMAYGRDAQAEEILKEALTKDPGRHEIRLKLLEIYAARKNPNAFEAVAGEMYAALGGQASPLWDKAAEMGRALDPHNPLYREKPKATAEPSFEKVMVAAGAAAEHGVVLDLGGPEIEESAAADLDINLDIAEPAAEAQPEIPPAEEGRPAEDLGFDFDLGALARAGAEQPAAAPVVEAPQPAAEATETQESALELDIGALPQAAAPEAPAAEGVISAEAWKDEVMSLEFEAGEMAAPAQAMAEPEAAASAEEVAEVGGAEEAEEPEEASVLDFPDFAGGAETPLAESEMESIELAAAPVEETPLDFDFNLDQEETAAPAEVKELAVPDLDLSGISLEMDELAATKAAPVELPEDFGSQEVATKLDLAKAYTDMGDKEGAREILQEVLKEGAAEQQEEARKLLAELD